MAEDLAIDIGLPKDSSEFVAFVAVVTNILDNGCTYNAEATEDIIEKCNKSDLDIAKKIIRACQSKPQYRKSQQQWWETWQSADRRRPMSDVRRQRPEVSNNRRPMSPMFNRRKRPMSPMFNNNRRKRPMSPMFNNNRRKRPMSPMFNRRKRPMSNRPSPQRRRVVPQYGRNNRRDTERDTGRYTERDTGRDTERDDVNSDVPDWSYKRRRVR